MKKDLSFEAGMQKLESIVGNLESENIGLEEAISLFKEGSSLTKFLKENLDKAELEIKKLTKDENGNFQLNLLE
ncbi:exodeoxyribonuclease VII small subunit [candidate division KSB1 bacterium]